MSDTTDAAPFPTPGLPEGRYVELPGRGHNLPLEEPETFARIVQDFLA